MVYQLTDSEIDQIAERAAARAIALHSRKVKKRKDWITQEEACDELNCSSATLRRRVNNGYIRRTGERNEVKFFNAADIQAWKRGERQIHKPE